MQYTRTIPNPTIASILAAGIVLTGCGGDAGEPRGTAAAAVGDRIALADGAVLGNPRDANGLMVFKGIPYAAAPVGARRWRAPEPVAPWSGEREAKNFGAPCWSSNPGSGVPAAVGASEDCLFLNIWTGARASDERRPVMVWLHGGGFQFGTSGEPRHDGSALAKKGVVLVSINYRLGVFGFLAHPDLNAEAGGKSSGMYGMQDQIAALDWVKKNIAQFGGDPNNVTVFGESAGAHAVGLLMASPLAAGRFDKAIGQSGAFWESENGAMRTRAEAENMGKALQSKQGAATLADLRAVPAGKLAADTNWTFATDPGVTHFSPNVDGHVLAEQPAQRFALGRQLKVPLLVGWNVAEDVLFRNRALPATSAAAFSEAGSRMFGRDRLAEFLTHYPAASDAQAMQSANQLIGDQVITAQTWQWANLHKATGGQPVYTYYFKYTSPLTPVAIHSADIEYVFNTLGPRGGVAPSAADLAMADTIATYWANFARSSNPNGTGLPNWPAYTGAGGMTMGLGTTVAAEAETGTARLRFLNSFRKDGLLQFQPR